MRRLFATITAMSLAGCSMTTAVAVPRTIPADLELGRLAERTAFEEPAAATPAPAPAPAPASDTGPAEAEPADDPAAKGQSARVGLFWTGIAFIAIGGAGTVAFAATGQATQRQLDNGYDDASLTREREKQLRDRGDLVNTLAITTAALGLLGVAFAAIAYGIDYTKCGKLAKRRKKCRGAKR